MQTNTTNLLQVNQQHQHDRKEDGQVSESNNKQCEQNTQIEMKSQYSYIDSENMNIALQECSSECLRQHLRMQNKAGNEQ